MPIDSPPSVSKGRIAPVRIAWLAAAFAGVMLTAALVGSALAPAYADRPPGGASEADFKAFLDRAAPATLRRFGVPGAVISTVIRGAPAHTYAYGFADVRHHRSMTPDTVFSVASLTKSLTAWGVLRLVQDGSVRLDAPVGRYLSRWPLPPSPYPTSAVTVRRLLNHTAGLNAGDDEFRRPGEASVATDALLAGAGEGRHDPARPARLVAAAGKSFLYSAPGYTVLQLLIEEQTHQGFSQFMKAGVLEPLEMTSSSFGWDPALGKRMATPYLEDGTAAPILVPRDLAADALFSTGPDMAKFVAAPLPDARLPAGAGVLAPRLLRPMYTAAARLPQFELQGLKLDGPGLGCFIERLSDGQTVVMNGGYDPGWASQFYIVPRTGDGIVILTNSDLGEAAIAEILGAWSTWRGLPPMQVTRAHYLVRFDAALAIGVFLSISLCLGAALIVEAGAGQRRFGDFNTRALLGSLAEAVLAIGFMAAWVVYRQPVQAAIPVSHGLGRFAIMVFATVVLARIVMPKRRGFAGPRVANPRPAVLSAFGSTAA